MFETQNIMQRGFSPVGIRLDIMPKKYLSFSYAMDVDLNSQGQGGAQSVYMTLDSTQGTDSHAQLPGDSEPRSKRSRCSYEY